MYITRGRREGRGGGEGRRGGETYNHGLFTVHLHITDLSRQHSELLKVDQSLDLRVIPIICKGQVLLDDGEEWYEGRGGVPLELSVLGHVVEGVHVVC